MLTSFPELREVTHSFSVLVKKLECKTVGNDNKIIQERKGTRIQRGNASIFVFGKNRMLNVKNDIIILIL